MSLTAVQRRENFDNTKSQTQFTIAQKTRTSRMQMKRYQHIDWDSVFHSNTEKLNSLYEEG
ncbi:hypothetical protein T11_16550 [Trichinella zimbabwensis]|uniref:Uncharacterized protein n=1 Tax=Trichinella zimbabwensis TaxID=268475 RepID=A0A0V1H294_9BILA|nr:hypothetical protein T11_16550 [Trichinella zimbabwensis]